MARHDSPVAAGQKLPLILASASPRRKLLFERFFPSADLRILIPEWDETAVMTAWTDTPESLARRLTSGKIEALSQQHPLPGAYCAVAADTLVVLNDRVFGKPSDRQEAVEQLRQLSGRTHLVLTGLTVAVALDQRYQLFQATEQTAVRFTPLSEAMIRWYVATGEPDDKAGSYGIQGDGAALIESINGCFYNVMGLPVFRLLSLLHEAAQAFGSHPQLSDFLPWNGSGPL